MQALLSCQPPARPLSTLYSLLCCSFIGLSFVLSLYVFVPASTRRLPREDARHVRARLCAVAAVSVFTTFVFFPLAFCSGIGPSYSAPSTSSTLSTSNPSSPTSSYTFLEYQGLPTPSLNLLLLPSAPLPPAPLLHVMLLFLGPLTLMFFNTRSLVSNGLPLKAALAHTLTSCGLPPTFDVRHWSLSKVRDLLAAPLFEELCFRGALVPFLLRSQRYCGDPKTVIFVAPLFFGVAHVHHALVGLSARFSEQASLRAYLASSSSSSSHPHPPTSRPPMVRSLTSVFLPSLVQFSYTYLFGCYCVYGLLLAGRVSSVVLCHSFCNLMGLPDVSFWTDPYSDVRPWRKIIAAAYFVGIVAFAAAFWHIGKGHGWGEGTAIGASCVCVHGEESKLL